MKVEYFLWENSFKEKLLYRVSNGNLYYFLAGRGIRRGIQGINLGWRLSSYNTSEIKSNEYFKNGKFRKVEIHELVFLVEDLGVEFNDLIK